MCLFLHATDGLVLASLAHILGLAKKRYGLLLLVDLNPELELAGSKN